MLKMCSAPPRRSRLASRISAQRGGQAAETPSLGAHARAWLRLTSDIVLLPREHNLWRAIVPRRDVARHLRILQPRQSEIANLEIAVLVDENVGRLEVAVDDARRVRVLQAALPLQVRVGVESVKR